MSVGRAKDKFLFFEQCFREGTHVSEDSEVFGGRPTQYFRTGMYTCHPKVKKIGKIGSK